MEIKHVKFSIILILLLITLQQIDSVNQNKHVELLEKTPNNEFNPLENLILNQDGMQDVNRSGDPTTGLLPRVKRQYGYDPYYYRQYPYPLPIFIGLGGFGFGGRGFGGRGFGGFGGFGGRGFGGFGGRGFGGFGGRGFGGFGGRGFGGFGGRGFGSFGGRGVGGFGGRGGRG